MCARLKSETVKRKIHKTIAMKNLNCLIFCLFFLSNLCAQEIKRERIYTKLDKERMPAIQSHHRTYDNYPKSPDFSGECMVSVDQRYDKHILFYNGEKIGVFPEEAGFSAAGDVMIIDTIKGKKIIKVLNKKVHGPFYEILDYKITNGHLIVTHFDTLHETTYLYVDSSNVSFRNKYTSYCTGPIPSIWQEPCLVIRKNIFIKDSLFCSDCAMSNYRISGEHYFFSYHFSNKKTKTYFFVDDIKKDIIVDGYWSPQIDSFGNFYLPCKINDQHFVQTKNELFGPIRDMETLQYSSGAFGLIFKYQKELDELNKYYLYQNGVTYGPWDSLEIYLGIDIYYFENNGKKFLGQNGKTIFEFTGNSSIKNIAYNSSGKCLFESTNDSIFLNFKPLGKFSSVREMWLNEDGRYFILYKSDNGSDCASINGQIREFDAQNILPSAYFEHCPDAPGFILLSKNYDHFLLYNPRSDFFILDGRKHACIPEKTKFYYIKQSNSFCWLTIEGNDIYWQTVNLD